MVGIVLLRLSQTFEKGSGSPSEMVSGSLKGSRGQFRTIGPVNIFKKWKYPIFEVILQLYKYVKYFPATFQV